MRCETVSGGEISPEMAKEWRRRISSWWGHGVGKTEIARRLAELVKAPFVKVEATKFTEVGYVGRDVESIIEISPKPQWPWSRNAR